MYDDEILWTGLMNGDKEMFLALYRKYYHHLFFIGLREVKDSNVVKDAIQQLFLYLWEKRSTIQFAKNAKNYLVSSFLRTLNGDRKKMERTRHVQMAWSSYSEQAAANPEEKMMARDEEHKHSELLADRIKTLPARQKELIILRFYEGFTYEQIVEKTGLTHRTVYNNIFEALKKLKLEFLKKADIYGTALSVILLCNSSIA